MAHDLIHGQQPRLANIGDILITFLALALTLVLSALSYKYFEKRIIALGRRIWYDGVGRLGLVSTPRR